MAILLVDITQNISQNGKIYYSIKATYHLQILTLLAFCLPTSICLEFQFSFYNVSFAIIIIYEKKGIL